MKEIAKQESQEFSQLRKKQKEIDLSQGIKDKNGRHMKDVPDDFLHLTRVIGLLRGLAIELEVECPILHILCIHAYEALGLPIPN